MKKPTSFLHLVLLVALVACAGVAPASGAGGSWKVLQRSVGVSGMQMQLLHTDRVILFDRNGVGPSNLTFPAGHACPGGDCTAHAVEYNVASNTARPLTIVTDTWCSSGYVAPDGTLVQNGGYNAGNRTVRTVRACTDGSCDWVESPNALAEGRWYGTNEKLPDGGAIIVGGLGVTTYEFLPKVPGGANNGAFIQLRPFLSRVNTLYPFVHLNIDGNLFIFANNRAILFDYKGGRILREYPQVSGLEPRTNPFAGSSVLLPLKPNPTEAEVLICGGAPAPQSATAALPALDTCKRLKITDPAAQWVDEPRMPSRRVMGDMILLPNGEVAIINGAKDGLALWESAKTPNLTPLIYQPDKRLFVDQAPATTPRMYHSSVVLLRDGRLLVGGSNPHERYEFTKPFPTDLSLDAFSPDYLDVVNDKLRPKIFSPSPSGAAVNVKYKAGMKLAFSVPTNISDPQSQVRVTMIPPSFTTHSYAQNQRLLLLQADVSQPEVKAIGGIQVPPIYEASVTMPASATLAPPGYYMVFVVNGRIPCEKGIWVHID
ncbi:hypothetical protein ACP70R_009898 [Stipagrostis hirtigluma subsp. patula]